MSKLRTQVRNPYIMQFHVKDKTHFGTTEDTRGALKVLFRRLDFKPLVFRSFAESSSNMKDFVEMAVEYRVEHLGTSMAASNPYIIRVAPRRRFRAQLVIKAWRGYANLILDGTKYVGTEFTGTIRAKTTQDMLGRADACEYVGI